MAKVVGVRFRNVGKVYYFDPKDYDIKSGSHVIVETARGIEYGNVVMGPKEVSEKEVIHPLKEVLRVATEDDDERERANRQNEREAFRVCQQKIREHELDMKLIDAEYTFDNNKVLFYFTADGRIDFRQLVKDLAAIFKTRIELRQIGVRDETKILGGIGICGRCLCCHTYLSEFAPVSIKMAKEQNLSLNQTKISGVCGRLMCCLKNEQETYEELNKQLPKIGDSVTTPDGHHGTVHSVNVLRQLVKVMVEIDDEKELQEYPVKEIQFRPRKKKGKNEDPEDYIREERGHYYPDLMESTPEEPVSEEEIWREPGREENPKEGGKESRRRERRKSRRMQDRALEEAPEDGKNAQTRVNDRSEPPKAQKRAAQDRNREPQKGDPGGKEGQGKGGARENAARDHASRENPAKDSQGKGGNARENVPGDISGKGAESSPNHEGKSRSSRNRRRREHRSGNREGEAVKNDRGSGQE
ncbi:MAG: stage 0 sporulation family protein [Blautia sp.]|nr:stage 0 sporulation family protein [Blautia sp.]